MFANGSISGQLLTIFKAHSFEVIEVIPVYHRQLVPGPS
jgi:hypothetical protein